MKHSLINKITISFVIILLLVTALFMTFGMMQMNRTLARLQTNQVNAVNYLIDLYNRSTPPRNIEQYFKNFGMEFVKDKNLITNVLTGGRKIFTQNTPLGSVESVEYGNSLFLNIKNDAFVITFESIGTKNINDPLWMGYILSISLLLSLYLSMLKSFVPLKKLSTNIKKFASGNMDIMILDKKRDDEIGQVATEFENAVSQIKELVRSRQLFLRTIMHELKTPIGKGRIISELIDDEVQKKRLVNVFERLEILINEFAKIEQLLSRSYSLQYQECHFSLILEQTRDILMLDNWDDLVSVEMLDDAIINVDFQLFTLALKNLIDNGLKYSSDKRVNIICETTQICISNKGNPLPMNFEHYKQAFVRNKDEKAGGMGLGLYIIDKICTMHKFNFDYNYCEGKHHFCVIFDKPALINKQKKKTLRKKDA